ncbi:MAG: hypothetical protein AB1505_35120 [Candidatus Latescibacterota bacterium]
MLETGRIADITVFDPERIQEHATFREGNAYATGIDLVLLAGQVALEHDVVLVRRPPAAAFLEPLRRAGLRLPAFGQSGRDQARVDAGGLRPEQSHWLARLLAEQGSVVVEPWLDRVCDLSFHLDILAPGQAAPRGWTRFLTDERGRYRGSWVCGGDDGLAGAVSALLQEARLRPLLEEVAAHAAAAMAESGYVGPVGVDALLYRDGDAVRLKPIVEVNPRFTMGRIALALRPHVAAGAAALWTVLSGRQTQGAGAGDLAGLVARLPERAPLQREPQAGRLLRGVLPTTDPSSARAFASALVVGNSPAACAAAVGIGLG